MTPTVKSVIDKVLNGEEHHHHATPPPHLTSSSVRTRSTFQGVSENYHDEIKRNATSMDELRHTKQRFKMPVSTMSTACSICSKTSQSGVGGICKGCWTQFQAKGVRIGNIEEFKEFTESVKNNVSKITTVKNNDEQSSSSQIPIVDSLRELIPSIFFKNKHKKQTDPTISRSISVENVDRDSSKIDVDSATKTVAPKFGAALAAISDAADKSCKQSNSTENTSKTDTTDYVTNTLKNAKKEQILRSKTFVDPTRCIVPDTDNKLKANEKSNTDIESKYRYMEKKVTRAKTQFCMKSYLEMKPKALISSDNIQGTENRDKSNDITVSNSLRTKRSESEHTDFSKQDKFSRKLNEKLNEKQKYEPITVKESSKLNLSQKFESQFNRDKKNDSRYNHTKGTDKPSQRRFNSRSNHRVHYDSLKLGTRSMKGNAFRMMATGNKSSSDEDDDDESKSKGKEKYKALEVPQLMSSSTLRGRLSKKQNAKEVKSTRVTKCPFAVQNKYSEYSQKRDEKKNSSDDKQKQNDSIYFPEHGLVETLSSFINKTDCFKNDESQAANGKDIYYSGDKSPFINNLIKKNNVYYDDKPALTMGPDDYTTYKHGMTNMAALKLTTSTESAAVDSSASEPHMQSHYYTNNTKSYCSSYSMPETRSGEYTQHKNCIKSSEDTYYSGGFNRKNVGYESSGDTGSVSSFAVKSKGCIDCRNEAGSFSAGESYSGYESNSMGNKPSSGNDMYTGSVYENTPLTQQIVKPIFLRPASDTTEPACARPILVPSFTKQPEKPSIENGPQNKQTRLFRKRNKAMDEMVEKSIDSAGEFFTKAMVSFKNPFNNFNSNSNLWYGKERNAIPGAFHDDMCFEKPNYTDWDPEIKPKFIKPAPKKVKEPLVLDFLKYENENRESEEREYVREVDDSHTDEWYAGTQAGFHGPVNTTWDGRNWKNNKAERYEPERYGSPEPEEYTSRKTCRICPNNNNSQCGEENCPEDNENPPGCDVNNNYPDYDKYDKPVMAPKKIAKPESYGNDRDYAPMLYSVPDTYVKKAQPDPCNFKPPTPPTHRSSMGMDNSYFYAPQSQCDDEPEYAGYEKKREREVKKEATPPPVPKIIKVGSILIRNNVENDFDYAENVNRDLNDESFGAMGFNQMSQEMNHHSLPFPHATASTLMAEPGNLKQIIDVQQAIRRDWTASKTPVDNGLSAHNLPIRSAPMKMDVPHRMEHEEPVKKSSRNSKTRTTSVTSDAVHNRRGGSKETSLDLEPIKKPTVPRIQTSNSNSLKKSCTPRTATTPQSKQYTPRTVKSSESKRLQTPRQLNYTSDLKKRDKAKDHQQQGLLWKVVSKPLKVCGIIKNK